MTRALAGEVSAENTEWAVRSVMDLRAQGEPVRGPRQEAVLLCVACNEYHWAALCERVGDVAFCIECLNQSHPAEFYDDMGGGD